MSETNDRAGVLPGVAEAIEEERRNRRTMMMLLLLLLLVPILAAIGIAIFGKSDADQIRVEAKDEVLETITEYTPAIDKAVEQAEMAQASVESAELNWSRERAVLTEQIEEQQRELEPVRQRAEAAEKAVELFADRIELLNVNPHPGGPDARVERALRGFRDELEQATGVMRAELANTRAQVRRSEKVIDALAADLKRANADIEKLEAQVGKAKPMMQKPKVEGEQSKVWIYGLPTREEAGDPEDSGLGGFTGNTTSQRRRR